MMNRVLGLAVAIGLTLAVPVKTRADDDQDLRGLRSQPVSVHPEGA